MAFANNSLFPEIARRWELRRGCGVTVSTMLASAKGLRFGDDSAAFAGIKIATALRNPSIDWPWTALMTGLVCMQGFPSKQQSRVLTNTEYLTRRST